VPLRTLLNCPVCDGWHNLQGGEGELRLGWLLLPAGWKPSRGSDLPSPAHYIARRAEGKALRTSGADLAATTGGVAPPQSALVSARNELGQRAGGAASGAFTPRVLRGTYAPGAAGGGTEEKWDSATPWLEWRGDVVGSTFLDENGFRVPHAVAHEWQLAHSHWLCLQQSARPQWQAKVDEWQAAAGERVLGKYLANRTNNAVGDDMEQITRRFGVPDELRPLLWPAFAQADVLQAAAAASQPGFYAGLVRGYEARPEGDKAKAQIGTDLHRTLSDQHTAINSAEGLATLARVLGAYSEYNPRVGYCQSMNYVAAHLLCQLREEAAFWMLVRLAECVVPEFWGPNMDGLQAAAAALQQLAARYLPAKLARFEESMVRTRVLTGSGTLPSQY
jgi:hypothetical protein